MKVLVTGGCGLIGYHAAVHHLNKGDEVEVIDNLERSSLLGHSKVNDARKAFNKDLLTKAGIYVHHRDVSNPVSFKGLPRYDAIIHMAGQCGVPTSIEDPNRDFEVNLVGTKNVLDYARENDSKVVFASTNKVYPIHNQFVKEGTQWRFFNPRHHKNGFPTTAMPHSGSRTPYGWSKYSADLLCQEYYHTYGVQTGVFRMSCIYGTHQFGFEEQGWATWFVIATVKGLPLNIYGDGDQVRDMLYVEDTVKAYDAYLQSNIEHGVWNLGGGPENTLTLNECLDHLETLVGKRSEIKYSDWRPSDQKTYVSDIRAVTEALKWRPYISPRDGLRKVLRWVKENEAVF